MNSIGASGDHAACAQRQSGRISRRAAARVRPLGYGLSMDFPVSGQRFGVLRYGYGIVRPRDLGPAGRDRGTHPADLDQTTASDRHQILMLSVRWGALRQAQERAAAGLA